MTGDLAVPMSQVNEMSAEEFVELLGGVYEHSPWIAEAVVDQRPFDDRSALQTAMKAVVDDSTREQKIALLRAHPEFAGKAATTGTLTESSTAEQSRLSLNNLPVDQHQQMQQYNRQFMEKFGFPGIVAVRLNNSVEQIFQQFDRRLQNDFEEEVEQALEQVHAIVGFRIGDLLADG
jgi:2-oxo-4-hydroxy-4-carboxy-5-ureidoimidazoline decarboxylase